MTPFANATFVTIDRWYAAYDAQDVDELCEIAHPDIVVLPHIPALPELPGATFSGRSGLRTFMQWSFDTYPRVAITSTDYRAVPPSILAATTFVLDERASPRVQSTSHTLFDVDDGAIRRVAVFLTEDEALAAVGTEPAMTPREREVFQLLARGLTTPEIADELFVSTATVRTHVQNGIRRLGAKTRIQAVSMALKRREISS